MAIPTGRLIQDQNLDIHFTGGSILGEKNDGSKAQKKGGGLGSRKALNDISNSAKPLSFQVSKKHNSNNVIAIDRDTVATSKTPFSVGGMPNGSNRPQKGQSGGRKALSDLTNSGKPSVQKITKKSQDTKLDVMPEEFAIEDEGFLHNHQECSNAKKKIMDKACFLKLVGLEDGPPYLPPDSSLRCLPKHSEVEEMPVLSLDEDPVLKGGRFECPGFISSPTCLSPVSPRLSAAHWKLNEDKLDFTIIESPKHPKAGLIH
ncbi:hypothetical protein Leryth_009399 [Lithospermum erythrorhizon]|uniref:Uncharacterized protein n=1 Tax=Lithospermum erythrorhizon TaxID=34254 RepID=A0AAV3NYH5_LITER|nr:hypothetical protein Leryth_009399 [Lithospermum erythrorhizon]